MSRQSNILSLDAVKRSSRTRSQAYDQPYSTSNRSESRSSSKSRSSKKSHYSNAVNGQKRQAKHAFSAAELADDAVDAVRAMRDTARESTQDRKKKRAKSRADKMFDRQMAASTSASSGEGGPRAAVYKTKMGSTHRRSTRMQRSSEAGSWSAKINPAGWFSGLSKLKISSAWARVITVALCMVLAGVFLYTPAQQYYQSVREHDRLVAEYVAVYERNVALDRQNETLASDAGMEDAVRERYGYIIEGEEMARVSGLSETALAREGNDEIEANVLSVSVKAPEEWYTPFLDAFFGVK